MRSRLFCFKLALALACAFPAGSDADEPELKPEKKPVEEKCGVVFEGASGEMKTEVLPSLHVMSMTEDSEFLLPADAPGNVKAVQCGRESLAPVLTDIKVLTAGFPLAIISTGRVGVLEIHEGRLRFNMLDGTMTEPEMKEIGNFLDQAQSALLMREKQVDNAAPAP